MAGEDHAALNQILGDGEGRLEGGRPLPHRHGGRHVGELVVHLGERGASHACGGVHAAPTEVDEEDARVAVVDGELEVGGDGERDVGAGGVEGDRHGARRLDHLPVRLGRHGETVFAAVHGDTESDHGIGHRLDRIEHGRPLARQLRRPHPIRTALHLLQRAHLGPHQVRDRLPHRHRRPRRGVHQPFNGRFPDRRGAPRDTDVTLSHDGDVGEGDVERPHALLLGHHAGHAAVDFDREEALRSDGEEAEDTVEGGAHGDVGGEDEGEEGEEGDEGDDEEGFSDGEGTHLNPFSDVAAMNIEDVESTASTIATVVEGDMTTETMTTTYEGKCQTTTESTESSDVPTHSTMPTSSLELSEHKEQLNDRRPTAASSSGNGININRKRPTKSRRRRRRKVRNRRQDLIHRLSAQVEELKDAIATNEKLKLDINNRLEKNRKQADALRQELTTRANSHERRTLMELEYRVLKVRFLMLSLEGGGLYFFNFCFVFFYFH